MPNSRSPRTACPLGGAPSTAPTPAESTRKSLRPFTAWRKRPSAIGLRQIFPVQTNRIVFIPYSMVSTCGGAAQSSTEKSDRAELLDDRQTLQQVDGPR